MVKVSLSEFDFGNAESQNRTLSRGNGFDVTGQLFWPPQLIGSHVWHMTWLARRREVHSGRRGDYVNQIRAGPGFYLRSVADDS